MSMPRSSNSTFEIENALPRQTSPNSRNQKHIKTFVSSQPRPTSPINRNQKQPQKSEAKELTVEETKRTQKALIMTKGVSHVQPQSKTSISIHIMYVNNRIRVRTSPSETLETLLNKVSTLLYGYNVDRRIKNQIFRLSFIDMLLPPRFHILCRSKKPQTES